MKILYILDFYKPNKWWIEVLFEQIIEHFWQKNEVSVITRKFDKNLDELEKNWNISIYRIPAKNLISFVFKARSFWKKIAKNVDIIHASNFYSALVASNLSKKFNKKSILHVNWFFGNYRFSMIDFVRAWKFKILERLNVAWNFNKYIAVSRYISDVLNFHYWVNLEKIETIYNWIDIEKWKKNINPDKVLSIRKKYKSEQEFLILFYWRIEKVKNVEMLLESIQGMDWIKIALMVHGDILYLKKIIEEMNLKEIVELIPAQKNKDIANYIKAVDAVVFPSLTEAFWYVALETCALWKPLICSNTWAIPEVVFWKVLFFNPKSTKSIRKAISNAKKGEFKIIKNKKFPISKTLEKIEKIYEKLNNKH